MCRRHNCLVKVARGDLDQGFQTEIQPIKLVTVSQMFTVQELFVVRNLHLKHPY